jgi:hypothetical protein
VEHSDRPVGSALLETGRALRAIARRAACLSLATTWAAW